jgi:hypothetical protein
VAHVQTAGNVRGGQEKREHRTGLAGRRRLYGEELFLDPIVGPACFNRAWLVRFWQLVRHEYVFSKLVLGQRLLQLHAGQAPAVRAGRTPVASAAERRNF